MEDLFNYYKNALADGLCTEYRDYWRSASGDKERLVKLAMSQQSLPHVITYCNEGRGMSKDYILENFAEYVNGRTIHDADGVSGYTYSLYVAFNGVLSASDDVSALLWCNSTSVEIKRSKCPVLYVGCGSRVRIITEGYSSLRIYLFDESEVILDDIDYESNVIIYKYSPRCKVVKTKFCMGQVKQFDKELKL